MLKTEMYQNRLFIIFEVIFLSGKRIAIDAFEVGLARDGSLFLAEAIPYARACEAFSVHGLLQAGAIVMKRYTAS